MALAKERGEQELNDVFLADDDLRDILLERGNNGVGMLHKRNSPLVSL